MGGDSGIFIDDNWKQQAQKEQDELSEKLDAAPEADPNAPMDASFGAHIESLAMQAMMFLGMVEHPAAPGKRIYDPGQARYLIDVIAMLRDKSEGNLTKEEEAYVARILPELQMLFVEMARMVAEQQGKAVAGGGAAGGVAKGPGVGGATGLVMPS
jgi:hypothetical protein